jgi:hypothetical protein
MYEHVQICSLENFLGVLSLVYKTELPANFFVQFHRMLRLGLRRMNPLFDRKGLKTETVTNTMRFYVVSPIPEDELADLLISDLPDDTAVMNSPWISSQQNRESILFPSTLIELSRSEPVKASCVDRLTHLWSISNSHGVSWDDLDEAFLSFHRDYLSAEKGWIDNYEARWEKVYSDCDKQMRKSVDGDSGQVALAMNRRRGKIRRMTYTRLARLRNKEVLKPFNLTEFCKFMREYVSQRVAKREQSERNI